MNTSCPNCQELIQTHKATHHPYLVLISTMPHSELYKCNCCKSYLHKYGSNWEVLISGDYSASVSEKTAQPQMQIDFLPSASGH